MPAIDLLGGRVVRLRRGRYDRVTTFDVDPVRAAAEYVEQGAAWLHVIDLDAARDGVRPVAHELVIRRLAARPDLRLQVGGGVRSAADVEALLELGVARVLVGTLAARDPETVGSLARDAGGVAVAVDVRGASVRAAGWVEDTGVPAAAFVERATRCGVRDFLVTAIDRDGTNAGPDTELVEGLRPLVPGLLIAAGGIGRPADVAAAAAAGADAVVVGRALYDGTMTYAEACASVRSSPTDRPS